jgi:hypothetical protein
MRKLFAWLGVAMLGLVASASTTQAGEPLKPYVVLVLDTSGSMVWTGTGNPTGSGPPSCGGIDNKLNHAKCAINNIVNSYGDMVFALGRFRTTLGGTTTPATFPAGCCQTGPDIGADNGCSAGPTCNDQDHMVQMLSPLVDGNNQQAGAWTNGTANTCTATGTDPEIWDGEGLCDDGGGGTCGGATPLEGVLLGSKRYWSGQQATNGTTIWPSGAPSTGFDPVRNDPKKTNFIPKSGQTTCNPNPTTCNSAANCTGANCCCVEQCRPYIVILLTDGAESCNGTPADGATALLRTDIDNRRYRIETKPIGFGISAPNAQIEAIAHAGGAPDLPGNEGYYANDEASLQLAISSILDDAIKTEVCNNLDDDCDVLVDEDFPTKGNACDNGQLGECRTEGVFVCRADGTGVQCNAPAGPAPGTEVCNTLDDDCDGKVDEGLPACTCTPQAEQCDNDDDDCDTRVDEGIQRPCGTGTCQGVETCIAGDFENCTAQTPTPEVCNGLDDNCDGVRDGFTNACSTMPPLPPENFPIDDPRNNPGHPTNNPIPENICHPGNKTCPANVGPPNSFGPCLGEQKPLTEVCNGLDDDCDNRIDEGTGGGDCSTTCGQGTIVCTNGTLECDSVQQPDDDTCDGNDDDCDGNVDEDWECTLPNCDCTATGQCKAKESCTNGVVVCAGTPISQESCNCEDDDCDDEIDEDTNCGGGATCTQCQCAFPCDTGEFPCPLGKFCDGGFCIADPCFQKDCPPVNGNHQSCRVVGAGYECVDTCELQNCASGYVCIDATGQCEPDNCITFPDRCTESQSCLNGVCTENLCFNVPCPTNQYCVEGECVGSCDEIDCPDGERCRMGQCETDPCGGPCPTGDACHDETGQCVPNTCEGKDCPVGQWCNPNNNSMCEDDPCVRDDIMCPDPADVCRGGTCIDPTKIDGEHVTTGGGGGCTTTGGAGIMLGLLALLLMTRRRRDGGRS